MSKKKRKKFGRGFTKSEKTVLLLGAALIILGIASLALSIIRSHELQDAQDIFTAEGKVTYCEIKQQELTEEQVEQIEEYWEEYDWHPYVEVGHYYKAKVDATLDGEVYKGVYYSDDPLSVGDIVEVSVIKKANGKYKVIDPLKYDTAQYAFWGVVSLIIGLGLALIAIFTRYMSNANARKQRKAQQQKV